MTLTSLQRSQLAAALAAVALAAGVGGYYLAGSRVPAAASTDAVRKPLYYYDPMVPTEHYDNADSLSSMGMKTIPKYADESGGPGAAPGVRIDPAAIQNLGIRLVTATTGTLAGSLDVTGAIDFNQRDVAIIQARAAGFVQRVYGRAPGDVIRAGAPIADVLVPEWGGAQAEYDAVRKTGDRALIAAAAQRLRLIGIPGGAARGRGMTTIRSPIGGVIQTLDARAGVTLAAGQTLAQVNGLGTVWLNAAVPEVRAADVRPGQTATAELAGFPGERFNGRVIAVLPTAQADSRTLTVRIELSNRDGRLRPGMFATVHLGDTSRTALLVPSEAVIRTGKRTLVMLADGKGRFRPAEVRIGREAGGQTEIVAGLAAGEKVVASGQFLLDSEASLTGIAARPIAGEGK
ncbi:efflux RND transporter periplasmic adaptor subunit [Sphingomonas donggukensis]|uniref:Efflux RND transporter periplasmic adaptor subunit n=1 Tax=Sphingomonas donggukensis TaxID=2949093 RepID=A0ABY4TZV2_9SPHN|nr:efflux RND transporter periplasmic adaptor subunit [Sphingomonas donggukensis]URW75853.1 efflux RND transporter periplasmic adaptor subunit [Sphingomonas donggukensis]